MTWSSSFSPKKRKLQTPVLVLGMKRIAQNFLRAASRRKHAIPASLKPMLKHTQDLPAQPIAHCCKLGFLACDQRALHSTSNAPKFSNGVTISCIRQFSNKEETRDARNWDGGESMADEMIRYSQSRRRTGEIGSKTTCPGPCQMTSFSADSQPML